MLSAGDAGTTIKHRGLVLGVWSCTSTHPRFFIDMGYCVYKHTAPNGKVYIGVTGRNPKDRFLSGHGYKQNVLFWRAIQKYGWKNIEHEILQDGLEKDVAYDLEQFYIRQYDSTNPEKGYNCSIGGKGGTLGCRMSDKTRENMSKAQSGRKLPEWVCKKISESHKGEKNPNYGKVTSEETKKKLSESIKRSFTPERKAKMSESMKNYIATHPEFKQQMSERMKGEKNRFYGVHMCGKDNPNYGKKLTDEQKQALSEKKGNKILCVETGIVYNSQKEAALLNGLDPTVFGRKLKKGQMYGWKHWRKYEPSF